MTTPAAVIVDAAAYAQAVEDAVKASAAYYTGGTSVLDDDAYDRLVRGIAGEHREERRRQSQKHVAPRPDAEPPHRRLVQVGVGQQSGLAENSVAAGQWVARRSLRNAHSSIGKRSANRCRSERVLGACRWILRSDRGPVADHPPTFLYAARVPPALRFTELTMIATSEGGRSRRSAVPPRGGHGSEQRRSPTQPSRAFRPSPAVNRGRHSGTGSSAVQELRIPRSPQQRPAYVHGMAVTPAMPWWPTAHGAGIPRAGFTPPAE